MKTFSLFLEDTGYQGGTAPIVEPPKVDPVSGTSLVKSEDDPMKEEDTDDIDEVAAIRSVNKELADIALDDLDEALEKIQEVLATIGVTFDQESAKSALGSSDQIEVALHDNPTDVAEPIAIYGKDDEGNEEAGELTLCIHKDDDDYKAYLHVYFGEEQMRLSDLSLEDKDGEDNATDLTSKYTDSEEMSEEEGEEDKTNPVDVVKMDIPLFIRMLEFAREDAVDDEQLHAVTERITKMAAEGNIITMAEYDKIVGAPGEEKESEDPNKDPNASEIKKTGHIEVYESKPKTLESFLQESSEDDSPQVVVYLKGKDVRSKVVKNKHAAHLVIKTEKADGIISITPVDTDEINKAKDQADTVKKDAKVKAKKKLENEAKKVAQLPMDEDEGQGIPPHGSENMEMDQTDKLKEDDSAKVIGDIVKIASGPMKELPHGNDLHKIIDVQDGKLLIQPWDQETEKPFPLKNIKYPHSAVLVDAADITSHDLLGMDIRLKEEDGPDSDPAHDLSGPGILTMPVRLSAAKTRGEQRAVLQAIANDPKDTFAPKAKRLLSKLFGIKEEDDSAPDDEQNNEDEEEDEDAVPRPMTH
jgi:hypothetical protein